MIAQSPQPEPEWMFHRDAAAHLSFADLDALSRRTPAGEWRHYPGLRRIRHSERGKIYLVRADVYALKERLEREASNQVQLSPDTMKTAFAGTIAFLRERGMRRALRRFEAPTGA